MSDQSTSSPAIERQSKTSDKHVTSQAAIQQVEDSRQQTEIPTFQQFQNQLPDIRVVKRHDPTKEPKTPHPYWNLDMSAIMKELREMAELVVQCIPTGVELDPEIQHASINAAKLTQVQRAAAILVALIGSQAAGKSQLTNALFDCFDLSLTGDGGFACTSAIVKYAFGSGNNFAAEVKFLDAKLREKMIDEHIRAWIAYHNDLDDSDDEDTGPRTRSQKQDEIESQRKLTAEEFFLTIFGSKEEFQNTFSTSPVNTVEFRKHCQLRCEEAMKDYDCDSQNIIRFSHEKPQGLLDQVKPFLSKVTGKKCLWPIVDSVTIRLYHPLLQEGLEIIDLPGSGDTNMLRAKLADDLKDSVDYELILGDTIRIGTDSSVLSKVRAAIAAHGPSKLRVIATKIDILSEGSNQQGDPAFDTFRSYITAANEDLAVAEEQGDEKKASEMEKYKTWLERRSKAYAISKRARKIDEDFGQTLCGIAQDYPIEIIHTSATEYLKSIKSTRITFTNQPTLTPIESGLPRIRQILYDLPATQNARSINDHIILVVPAFVDKIKRIVTQSDRDVGFIRIADDFDQKRTTYLNEMKSHFKYSYKKIYLKQSMQKIQKDMKAFRIAVGKCIRGSEDEDKEGGWCALRSPAFTKLLQNRGTVEKGSSKAKGLEETVNWNQQLAVIMESGFHSWYATHSYHLRLLNKALPEMINNLYNVIRRLITTAKANEPTTAKALRKWTGYQYALQSKITALIEEMMAEEHRILGRMTMKDAEGRSTNLIAEITKDIFDEAASALPAVKGTTKKGATRYATSIIKHRRELLKDRFLGEGHHFADVLISTFEKQLEAKMLGLIDLHFDRIVSNLDDFSKWLKEHSPCQFTIDDRGHKIRDKLAERIPRLDMKATALQNLLPVALREENKARMLSYGDHEGDQARDLSYYMEKAAATTKRRGETSSNSKNNDDREIKKVKVEKAEDE